MGGLFMDNSNFITVEFETLAEAPVLGRVSHADFDFMVWEFCDKPNGEPRKLCLRLSEEFQSIDSDCLVKRANVATKKGQYTNLARPQEIIVLSSLFLRQRLTMPTLVRMGDNPMIVHQDTYDPCHELRNGRSNLASLKEWFELLDKANARFRHDYLRAARLYYFACRLMDKDLGASYLMFTSAIEALAKHYELKNKPKLSEINAPLDEAIDDLIGDPLIAAKLRTVALKKEGFISKKFVEFVMSNLQDTFWDEGTGPDYGRVKREHMQQILKNIYNQRSLTLHGGEPFPYYVYNCPKDGSEICFASACMAGDRKWRKKDYIPYIHFMEKLTSHILRTYLKSGHLNTRRANKPPRKGKIEGVSPVLAM